MCVCFSFFCKTKKNCDKCNQRHTNCLESGFDLFFPLRDRLYQDFPFLSCVRFYFFACVFNSRFNLRLVFRIDPRRHLNRTAILLPTCTLVWNHSWMHLFFYVKEILFCFLLLDIARFHAVTLISGTILIQFELRKVCLLFLQRRIPFDCQLMWDVERRSRTHNLISARADC